jgi:FHS family Na+ dependent glucose MFS transporter 1
MSSHATTIYTSAGGATAAHIPQTIAYYGAFVALGLSVASFGPTLPALAEHTHTHLNEISFLFTARSLGYLLGSLRLGRLFDRRPGNPVMALMLLLMALMLALVPLVPSLWILTGVILVLGAAEGSLDVGGNTLLVWVHGRKVGPYLNGLHCFFGVGAFLSPVIVAYALHLSQNLTLVYFVLALLMLPVALWLLRLPNPSLQISSKAGKTDKSNIGLVFLIALFFFLYVGAEVAFGGWVYSYAIALNLSSASGAAYLTAAFWGALTIGRLLAVPLAARLRPRTILGADLVGCLLSLGTILLWSNSLAALSLATFGLGLSMASIFPTTLSLAERRMTITGRVTGWFIVGASAGSMFSPWLIGQLFEAIGPRITIVTILVDMTLAVSVFVALIRYSTRTPDWRRAS